MRDLNWLNCPTANEAEYERSAGSRRAMHRGGLARVEVNILPTGVS